MKWHVCLRSVTVSQSANPASYIRVTVIANVENNYRGKISLNNCRKLTSCDTSRRQNWEPNVARSLRYATATRSSNRRTLHLPPIERDLHAIIVGNVVSKSLLHSLWRYY